MRVALDVGGAHTCHSPYYDVPDVLAVLRRANDARADAREEGLHRLCSARVGNDGAHLLEGEVLAVGGRLRVGDGGECVVDAVEAVLLEEEGGVCVCVCLCECVSVS